MDSKIISNTEEQCVVYPWVRKFVDLINNIMCYCSNIKTNIYVKEPCHDNEMQMKASFEDNYLDHMSNLKIESNPSQNTLTTIACGIRTYIISYHIMYTYTE